MVMDKSSAGNGNIKELFHKIFTVIEFTAVFAMAVIFILSPVIF